MNYIRLTYEKKKIQIMLLNIYINDIKIASFIIIYY